MTDAEILELMPQINPLTKTTDVGFAIRDLFANKVTFPTFTHRPDNGRWEENGTAEVQDVLASDPNCLRIILTNGQRFTVRITCGG